MYTFFVQWSPDVYGKDAKEQGFVVVEKEELNMIDNFFSEPTTKSWEVSAWVPEMRSSDSDAWLVNRQSLAGHIICHPLSSLLSESTDSSRDQWMSTSYFVLQNIFFTFFKPLKNILQNLFTLCAVQK